MLLVMAPVASVTVLPAPLWRSRLPAVPADPLLRLPVNTPFAPVMLPVASIVATGVIALALP